MLWQLDYVSLLTNSTKRPPVQTYLPTKAMQNEQVDVALSLQNDDEDYMVHDQAGQQTQVSFNLAAKTNGLQRSVFMHSKGYYLSNKVYEGKVKRSKLSKFKKEAAFATYSRQLFEASGL